MAVGLGAGGFSGKPRFLWGPCLRVGRGLGLPWGEATALPCNGLGQRRPCYPNTPSPTNDSVGQLCPFVQGPKVHPPIHLSRKHEPSPRCMPHKVLVTRGPGINKSAVPVVLGESSRSQVRGQVCDMPHTCCWERSALPGRTGKVCGGEAG